MDRFDLFLIGFILFIFLTLICACIVAGNERENVINAYQTRYKLSREDAEAQYLIDKNKNPKQKDRIFFVPISWH